MPEIWLLHYLFFPVVLAAVLTAKAMLMPQRGLRMLLNRLPVATRVVIAMALAYVIASFVWLVPATGIGQPVVKDGRFFFFDHGKITEVTEAAFHFHNSQVLRLYSSVWAYLYLAFGVGLLSLRLRENSAVQSHGAS